MERIRILNVLRISAATLCLAACALTLALWPLSYYRQHKLTVALTPQRAIFFSSEYGRLGAVFMRVRDYHQRHALSSYPPVADSWLLRREATFGFYLATGFSYHYATGYSNYVEMVIPDWFIALATGGMGIALLKRWHRRFTLRMLFVATTILAVVLGLMVYKR